MRERRTPMQSPPEDAVRYRGTPIYLTWKLALWGYALPMLLIAAGSIGAWAQAQSQRDDIKRTAVIARQTADKLEVQVNEHETLTKQQSDTNRRMVIQICESANVERQIVANLVLGVSRSSPNLTPEIAREFARTLLALRPKDCEKAATKGG